MRAAWLVAASLCASCATGRPELLDPALQHELGGVGGESLGDLELSSRPAETSADSWDVEVMLRDALRLLFPLLLERVTDPRAARLASRLRALPANAAVEASIDAKHALDATIAPWAVALSPGDRGADGPLPASPITLLVRAARELDAWYFERTALCVLHSDYAAWAPPTIARIAEQMLTAGVPRERVLAAVHEMARDVRSIPRTTSDPRPSHGVVY